LSILKVRFGDPIRNELDEALVDEDYLAAAIRREGAQPLPGSPGLVMCNLMVPVPRESDPETAELRRVSVTMSDRADGGVEVVRLDGLRPRSSRRT